MSKTGLVADLAADDRYSKTIGIKLVNVSLGRVVVRCKIEDRHLNFNGGCHGGVIFSLADSAFGLASNAAGTMASGISASIIFNSAARVDDILTATAEEISKSRKLATYRVDVVNQRDLLIASFTGMVYLMGSGKSS
ncbi:PaaI family thioesterase [Haliea sp.]